MDREDTTDLRNRYLYCKDCGILFELGCFHYESDLINSEDQILNAHFITRWKDRASKEVYSGMPHFDNPDDWFENVNRVEVLQMGCPQSNAICKRNRCLYEGEGCPLVKGL
jgi:hypothetical protein